VSNRAVSNRDTPSTCDALSHVQNFITEAINDREVAAGISLDIQNAFNSIRWKEIRKALVEKGSHIIYVKCLTVISITDL